MSSPEHLAPRSPRSRLLGGSLLGGALAAAVLLGRIGGGGSDPGVTPSVVASASVSASATAPPSPTPTEPPPLTPESGPANTTFAGLTTFRGNASRSWYGRGPIPRREPSILWRYPVSGSLCMTSATPDDPEKLWCGTGWTGQPNVIVGEGGAIEIRIGAYDGSYHFLDGDTGEEVRPELQTGDLAKGSATSDPDGYPLYYGGSRDNLLRVIALDRDVPTVLWSLDSRTSVDNPVWNTDWDGAPLVVGDYLIEGGENSWLHVIRLHRGYDADGLVTVDPELVFTAPGFDDELLRDLGDREVSIENSVAYRDGIVYFANSGGLVQGWDISDVLDGGTQGERVFRFWMGDDVDASIVIDDEGFLYVAAELQRFDARSAQVGQLVKLDPSKPDDPIVWRKVVDEAGKEGLGGIWATPALWQDTLFVGTNAGDLLALDRMTGRERWRIHLGGPVWSSPVPIGDVLLQGDCQGLLHAYDLSQGVERVPRELWTLRLPGCVESTPAVWKGRIYVGTRGGAIYGVGLA